MACACELSLHLLLLPWSLFSHSWIFVALVLLLLCSVKVCYFLLKFTICLHFFDHFVSVNIQLVLPFLYWVDVRTYFGKLVLHAWHGLLDVVECWDGLESVQSKQVRIKVESDYTLHAFIANKLNLVAIASSTRRWNWALVIAEKLYNLIASLSISCATMWTIVIIDKFF